MRSNALWRIEGKEHSTAHSMGTRRTAKVAEAIREVVSSTILFELRDPRIQNVTVLGVDVPADLRSAKVRVSVRGDESQQRLTMRGLSAARGFLQGKVGDRLNLRFTPVLSFEIDEGVKKSAEASRILRQLAEEREAREPDHPPAGETATTSTAEATAAPAKGPSAGESSDESRSGPVVAEPGEHSDSPG